MPDVDIQSRSFHMCVHVKEDDKSIIGLLPSSSETEATAVITITLWAYDDDDEGDAIDRLNEKITCTHAYSIDSVVKTKAVELCLLLFSSILYSFTFMNRVILTSH